MLTLYGYFRSSAAYRVRIGLHLKNIAYQDHFIHLAKGIQHNASYQKINPQQLIPSLELEDGSVLTQSLAILEYLDAVYPTPRLIPEDPMIAAKVRAFALAIACDIHPLNNLKVWQYLKNDLHVNALESGWYRHWLLNGLTALEQSLSSQSQTTGFCFGETPTMADVLLVPQLYNARRFKTNLDAFPKLLAIEQHCTSLPAFIKASPAEQADYEAESN